MTWNPQPAIWLALIFLRPCALAAAAGLLLRLFRIRHPASRHAAWTAVLAAMLLLPLASAVSPRWTVPLLRAKSNPAVIAAPVSNGPVFAAAPMGEPAADRPAQTEWPTAGTFALLFYFAGFPAIAAYRTAGWVLYRRAIARSIPIHGRRLVESADILTPVAAGVLRPIVILPAGWRAWTPAVRRTVLGHEFAHLRRGDTRISALTRLAQCVFWFHPLAWWLSRTISDLAELSCDAAALDRLHNPGAYSRVLLDFAGAVNRAGRRAALPGLAMAEGKDLGRRIDEIFALSEGPMRKLASPGVVLPLAGVPLLCLAAAVSLGQTSTPPQPPSQSPPSARPKFDVVSIKPCTDPDPNAGGRKGGAGAGGNSVSPGRLRRECANVVNLITMAYLNFPNGEPNERPPIRGRDRIEGMPSWTDSERYVIDATTSTPQPRPMMLGPMMQTLLEDRFKLRIHRETRSVPAYELTVARGGPRLQPSKPGSCVPLENGRPPDPGQRVCGGFFGPTIWGATLDDFVRNMSVWADREVVDRTGIAGTFDFPLDAAREPTGTGGPIAAEARDDWFAFFRDSLPKLGLKLESGKVPTTFIVIDHIERPSTN